MHNSKSTIQVTNNFGGSADITIHHRYDTSPDETQTWDNIADHATSPADYVVTYNTGWTSPGHDNWQATVKVHDGVNKGTWISDSKPTVTLHQKDNGKLLTFNVGPDGFHVVAVSHADRLSWGTHP